jgi:hypothetical protein
VGGVGRFEEGALQLCKLFVFTDKHIATLLSLRNLFFHEGARYLYERGLMGITALVTAMHAKIEDAEDNRKCALISSKV